MTPPSAGTLPLIAVAGGTPASADAIPAAGPRRRPAAERILGLAAGAASLALLLCAAALGLLLVARSHWDADLRPLLSKHRSNKVPEEGTRPTPRSLEQDRMRTYYPRSCAREDLTTGDPLDLVVPSPRAAGGDDAAAAAAAEVVLTHGAAVFPGAVDRNIVDAFRNYTLDRNAAMREDEQVYVMNSIATKGKRRTRWSFAFDGGGRGGDDPLGAVPAALSAVASHRPLAGALEALLGPDPAVVKMQTITARRGAEDQGWHPDVNAKAGAASHARTFVMHLSLFVPLQDTSMKMGATAVCPGSQFCTEIDPTMEDGCIQVASGFREENANVTRPVWRAGDAMLFNQNTFHMGAAHTDRNGGDRAVIVVTFTSRPRISDGTPPRHPTRAPLPGIGARPYWGGDRYRGAETRVLGLGTPLTSFGYTLRDLEDPRRSMSRLWSPLRRYGLLKPADANWGWDFLASLPGRVAAESHEMKRDDLLAFLRRLDGEGGRLRALARHFLLEKVPASVPNRGIWDVWFDKSLRKAEARLRGWLEALLLVATLAAAARARAARRAGGPVGASLRAAAPPARLLGGILAAALLLAGARWRAGRLALVRDIRSGIKLRPAFPLPPEEGRRRYAFLLPDVVARYDAGAFDGTAPAPAAPSRDDVLVGTRLGSVHLAGMNRFLDFHQGNRRWRRDMGGLGVPDLPPFLLDAMASSVVDRQLKRGRFLYQSREDGRFVEMPRAEGRRFTRRALVAASVPLVAELDRSVSFMVSHLLFESVLRDTLLARVAAGSLELLRQRLFREAAGGAPPTERRVRRRKWAMFEVSARANVVATVPRYVAPERRKAPVSTAVRSSNKKRRRADPKRIIELNKQKKKKRARKK